MHVACFQSVGMVLRLCFTLRGIGEGERIDAQMLLLRRAIVRKKLTNLLLTSRQKATNVSVNKLVKIRFFRVEIFSSLTGFAITRI